MRKEYKISTVDKSQVTAKQLANSYYGRRPLSALNLIDDFLFQAVVSEEDGGKEVCQILLSTILDRPIGDIHISTQKVLLGSDTDKHGIRLDACVETEQEMDIQADSEIYDIEPHRTGKKGPLPWRTRYYQALIDSRKLQTGHEYESLKKLYIIMILPQDPFENGRMVYTVCNQCKEDASVPYEDGVWKIYLNIRGTEGEVRPELQALLKYMGESTAENAVNENLQTIHRYVEKVKHNREVGVAYMRTREWLTDAIDLGWEYGVERGREEGMQQGIQQGIQEKERINQLTILLINQGRQEDLLRAAQDQEYQQELLEEFKL